MEILVIYGNFKICNPSQKLWILNLFWGYGQVDMKMGNTNITISEEFQILIYKKEPNRSNIISGYGKHKTCFLTLDIFVLALGGFTICKISFWERKIYVFFLDHGGV